MRLLLLAALILSAGAAGAADAPQLFRQHCAACHGADRLGGSGPALLPESLERLKPGEALKTLAQGRVATRMPGFVDKLSADELQALADYLYTPLPQAPTWGEAEIRASRIELHAPGSLPDQPAFAADMLNLFIVVESGDHHATLLDGDSFEPIKRFPTRFALHGGPKFSPDGRYVYFASRDGWVSKFDIWNLQYVAEIRTGINTRNIAVSGDGRYVMAANYLPHTLVLLDAADLSLLKTIAVADVDGHSSRVSAVYDAAPRKSFVVALKDVPELWEVSYDDHALPVYPGLVHDYQTAEALPLPGKFNPRRIRLETVLDDFFFDRSYAYLIGAAREGRGQVVNLDMGRKIADLPLSGMPHLGSGITWQWQGREVLATPNLKDGVITVIDMQNWQVVKQIKTPGPGFFMRSHDNTRYAWTDVFNGAAKDTLQLIDKQTLEVAASVTPSPGKTAAHVEFTRDGRYALVSVWENDGALVVYDAQTLHEVKRLPMSKPSGKYNVYNKITRSSGTSH
ncbi:MAG TPA: cytochrome D1 domain-containing protein [Novimethylophilus sp.]|jgi:cytochrome c553/WD40 repeat protein|uniref:cytochrome D1 domain-containing protein n=1 Tax=Novimethylophilus sp. TaxID=2137426 RepID=UPI002F40FFCE